MSESKGALPIDEKIWDYVEKMEGAIGINLGVRTLDLTGALYDIYFTVKKDKKEGLELLNGLAALLVAASESPEQVVQVWQELIVKESMKNFELRAQEVIDESKDDK